MEKVFLIIIITLVIGIGITYVIISSNPDKIEKLRLEEERTQLLDSVNQLKQCKFDSECILLNTGTCTCPTSVNDSNFVQKIEAYNTRIAQLETTNCNPACLATIPKCVQNKCILSKWQLH